MVLPSYNFAMSISKFFDDYEVKKLCAEQFQNIYVDCSDSCEYMQFPKSLKIFLDFHIQAWIVGRLKKTCPSFNRDSKTCWFECFPVPK